MEEYKIISVLVKNRFGVLTRVSNVFSRRGVNIKQLTVAETTTPGVSRITILVVAGDTDFSQFDKQLMKIEDVKAAVTLDYDDAISRELLLVKFKYDKSNQSAIQEHLQKFSAKIISFDSEVIVGRMEGSTRRIDEFICGSKDYEIVEMSRSGVTALDKLNKTFRI